MTSEATTTLSPEMREPALFGISGKVLAAGIVGAAIGGFLGWGTTAQRIGIGLSGFASALFLHPTVGKMCGALLTAFMPAADMPTELDLHVSAGFVVGPAGMIVPQAIHNTATAGRNRADDVVDRRLGADHDHVGNPR